MQTIPNAPVRSTFGQSFNYEVWDANTHITLTNVPWNNDYRDVWAAKTTDDLNLYIDRGTSENVEMRNATYAKVSEPILIEVPFNRANLYNYVRVYNPAQPVRGNDIPRYFYYFITDVRYVAPNTTAIVVQLDVWQTYSRQVTLGRCYVERGHLGIANTRAFQNYGRDYLTVPEGLDTGSDYVGVMESGDQQIMVAGSGKYSILVASTIKLEQNPGTRQNPGFDTAEGGMFQGLPSGASYYLFLTSGDFMAFMRSYSKYPWVTQGIISISVIPPITRYMTTGQLGAKLAIGAYRAPAVAVAMRPRAVFPNWRNEATLRNYIPARYRHLQKLWTFPYMAIELTTMTGQTVILKPEAWNSADALIAEEAALLPPNQRIIWYPLGYNSRQEARAEFGNFQGTGDDINYSVGLTNFPALAIVNDGAIAAMASAAHSISFGYQAADWSHQRALRSSQTSYDQASAMIQAGGDLTENQLAQSRAQMGIGHEVGAQQSISNALGSVGGGALMGSFAGLPGAAVGGLGGLISGIAGNVATLITQGGNERNYAAQALGARGGNAIDSRTGAYMRDTNQSLAQWAAKGDYENTIAGLNARTRDMQLTPPSIAGQVGGDALRILNFRFGYRLRWLMPDQANLQSIGEYWLRYGYAVQRFTFVPNDYMVMDRMTYWKMKETYIRAAGMPESFKQAFRGLFEKGVTVWASPDDIGMLDLAQNKPLPGISIDGYTPPDIEPEPTPEPPTRKRRNKRMIVFSTVDTNPATPGNVWALAGTSPGTDANWLETRDPIRAESFMRACLVDESVPVLELEFAEYRDLYRSPVGVQDIPAAPEEV